MHQSEELSENRAEELSENRGIEPQTGQDEQFSGREAAAPDVSGTAADETATPEQEEVTETVFVAEVDNSSSTEEEDRDALKAVIEAAIYITDEPLTLDQISKAVDRPAEIVKEVLAELVAEYARPDRGIFVRELAGGYKMGTKPEHHEAIRQFVKKLQPALKLSLPALETLAVIAYKQPITAPEIMEIRGVQGAGVLKTLLDRKLIATAGRKDVVGKPIMYKTTKEFLVQFGLSSLKELPTLKEFEELGRMALTDEMPEEEQTPFERPIADIGNEADGEQEPAPAEGEPESAQSVPNETGSDA
jgi:segregation and condensation protein B